MILWPDQVKIWELRYLQKTPIDRIRWQVKQGELSPSWGTVKRVVDEFPLLTEAEAMILPGPLQTRWRELKSATERSELGVSSWKLDKRQQDIEKIALRLKGELNAALSNIGFGNLQLMLDGKLRLDLEVEDRPFFDALKGLPAPGILFDRCIRWRKLVRRALLSDGSEFRLEVEDDPLFEALEGHSPSDIFFERFSEWKCLMEEFCQILLRLFEELPARINSVAQTLFRADQGAIFLNQDLIIPFLMSIPQSVVKYAVQREQPGAEPEQLRRPHYWTKDLGDTGVVFIYFGTTGIGMKKRGDEAPCIYMNDTLFSEFCEKPLARELVKKIIAAEQLRAVMSCEIDDRFL